MRLIDADELKKALAKEIRTNDISMFLKLLSVIDNAPTVKNDYEWGYSEGVHDTERPQGEWVKNNFKDFGAFGDYDYKCSICQKVSGGQYNFCSNCGADMRGGKQSV